MGNCCETKYEVKEIQIEDPEVEFDNYILVNFMNLEKKVQSNIIQWNQNELEKIDRIPIEYISNVKKECKNIDDFGFKENSYNSELPYYGPLLNPEEEYVFVGQFNNGEKEGKGI